MVGYKNSPDYMLAVFIAKKSGHKFSWLPGVIRPLHDAPSSGALQKSEINNILPDINIVNSCTCFSNIAKKCIRTPIANKHDSLEWYTY
eukprot:15340398-Ditylum_brightwellii.AAC.1